jgi:DMSO/TMAO reductase YedYZ molybdopterin-dependent catalytic subunit
MQRAIWLTILILSLAIQSVHAADDAVTVTGAVDKPGDWTVDKLKTDLSADVTSITYTGHDGKHTGNAVPLVSLLKAAGLQTDLPMPPKGVAARQKHAEMHYAVMVEGKDGYVAVFSIAELMPDLGNRHIYLALDVDGKPWPEKESPLKLVASDDVKPARWVHNVTKITVVKIEPPATQPAK